MRTSRLQRLKTSPSRRESSKKGGKEKNHPKKHDSIPEYVDWIDKKGKIIGQVDKNFAHRNGLLHPSVHVFVIDSKKRLILQFRSHSKKHQPSTWDTSAGGHVKVGEKIVHGARREALEELGIRNPLHYLGCTDVDAREHNSKGSFHHVERLHFFYSRLPKGTRLVPNEEFEKIIHLPLEKISGFIRGKRVTPSFLNGWKKFGPRLGRELR